MSVPDNLAAKRATLDERLHAMGRTLVAYSGGVDSAFLAWAAYKRLGADMMAVIADSPSLARTHLADAIVFAGEHEIPLKVIATTELDRPEYVRNDASRCFHCKDELFTVMDELRRAHGFDSIAYGVNVDDQADFRPGHLAAEQHRVVAPLRDVGLTKQDIRELARAAGLRMPILAHRVWTPRHSRGFERCRARRRRAPCSSLPPIPCPPPRPDRPHRDRPRGIAPGFKSGDGCRIDPHIQDSGLQVRHPRSRRLPLRIHELTAVHRSTYARPVMRRLR